VELAAPGPHDVLSVGETERDEKQPRLIHVPVVLIDDNDLGFGVRIKTPQPIGSQSATRSPTQDHYAICHHPQTTTSGAFVNTEPVKTFETSCQDFFCVSLVMVGLLIQATVGSLGGVGRRPQKRCGLAA
jgi:hypothetical protein